MFIGFNDIVYGCLWHSFLMDFLGKSCSHFSEANISDTNPQSIDLSSGVSRIAS
jgi:hypothetical protein